MSSTVTNYSNKINPTYPVPGVDNDTQGFRDNFANIKNALQAAAQELSYLDLNTAKLNTGTNDYNYGIIERAALKASGFTVDSDLNTPLEVGENNFIFSSGHYHSVTVEGSKTLSVTNWPENLYSTVLFDVKSSTTGTNTINFDTYGDTLKANITLPHILSTSTTKSHIFELWTADGGNNVFVKFQGTYTNV
jgi:hypothetical protein